MAGGRPTKYTEDLLEKAQAYVDMERPTDDEVIPTIEGMAIELGVRRETIHEWVKQEDKAELSNIVKAMDEKQGRILVNMGLSNKFNPKITTIMLNRHNYREGKEFMGQGGTELFSPEHKESAKKAISEFLG